MCLLSKKMAKATCYTRTHENRSEPPNVRSPMLEARIMKISSPNRPNVLPQGAGKANGAPAPEPKDVFRPQDGENPERRLKPLALLAGVAVAPAMGLALGSVHAIAENSYCFGLLTEELAKKGGIDSLVQLASYVSPTAMVAGTAVGLAGAVALATHKKTTPGSLLSGVGGAAGLALGSVGATAAGFVLSGNNNGILIAATVIGGILGAISLHALGSAANSLASKLLGNRTENKP